MPLTSLQALTSAQLQNVRLVAADMDGTLTQRGKFTASLLQALEDLAKAGIAVLIVTGRSAGWVSGLAAYTHTRRDRRERRFILLQGWRRNHADSPERPSWASSAVGTDVSAVAGTVS